MAFGVGVQLDQNSISVCKNEFNKFLVDLQNIANRNVIEIRVNNANNEINNLNNQLSGLNNTASNSTSNFKNMGSSIQSIIGFFLRWTAAVTSINFLLGQLKDGVKEIIDLNTANTNIAMITNNSIENVEKMNSGWLEMAKNLKVVNSEVVSGAESWLRSGVTMDEANKNLATTTKLAKIAGESNKDMADSLIVIKNAYGLNSQALTEYASKVSLLDNQSATSSEKINSAMQYSAESFKAAGIDTDTALSYVTNFSEKSAKSGSSIGNTFKSIIENFHKMQDNVKNGDKEETDAVNKLELLLAKKGIALRKTKDSWVDLGTVIKNIQENIGKFSQLELSDAAFKIGGKENMEATLSTLNNMQRIDELNSKLKGDSGATALNNSYSKYLQSNEAQIANLKNSLTQLRMSITNSSTINTVVKDFTNLLTATDRVVKGLGGLKNTVIILTTAIVAMKSQAIRGAITDFVEMASSSGILLTSITALSVGINALKTALLGLLTSPVTWAIAATTAIVGVITLAINHTQQLKEEQKELKEQTEKVTKAQKDFNDALDTKKVDDMKTALQGLKEALNYDNSKNNLEKDIEKLKELQNKNSNDFVNPFTHSLVAKVDDDAKHLEERIKNEKKAIKEYEDAEAKVKALDYETAEQDGKNIALKVQEANANVGLVASYKAVYDKLTEGIPLTEEENQLNEKMLQQYPEYTKQLNSKTNAYGVNFTALKTNTDAQKALAEVEFEEYKVSIRTNADKTSQMIDETQKRITAINTEIASIDALMAKQSEMAGEAQTLFPAPITGDSVSDSINKLKNANAEKEKDLSKQLAESQAALARLQATKSAYDTVLNSTIQDITGSGSGSGSGGYTPTAIDNSGKSSSSGGSDSDKSAEEAAKEAEKNLVDSEKSTIDEITQNYENFKNKAEDELADLDLANKILPEDDFSQKSELLQQKLSLVNSEVVQSKDQLDKLQATTVTTTDAQDELNQKIESATDEYRSQKSALIDLQTEIEKLNIDKRKAYFESWINFEESYMKELDDKDKLLASDDYADKLDILKDKQKSINSEINNTHYYLQQLGEIIQTTDTADGQKELSSALDDANEKLASQKMALYDVQKAMDDLNLDNIKKQEDEYDKFKDDVLNSLDNGEKLLEIKDSTGKDYFNKIEILNQKYDELAKNYMDTQDVLYQLEHTNATTAEGQKQLADEIENTKNKLLEERNAADDNYKAMEDLATNALQAYIEKQKEIDEMELEQKQTNEKTDLTKSIYGVSEDEWNSYKANKIASLKKDIQDLQGVANSSEEIQAKQTEIDTLNGQTYDSITDFKDAYTQLHQSKMDDIQAEIDAINNQSDAEQEVEDRLQRQNDLIKLQTELQNIKNDENIQELKQNADGTWEFEYTYDQDAYQKKLDEVNEKIKDNNKAEEDLAKKHRTDELNKEKQYEEDLLKSKEDSYSKQLSKLESTQQIEKNELERHYADVDSLVQTQMDNLKNIYGEKWDEIIQVITSKVKNATDLYNKLADAQAKGQNISNIPTNNSNSTGIGIQPSTGDEVRKNSTGKDIDVTKLKANPEYDKLVQKYLDAETPAEKESVRLEAQAIEEKYKIASLNTGGETPSWGTGGKIGILHEEEKILNKEDTKIYKEHAEKIKRISGILKNTPRLVEDAKRITDSISHFSGIKKPDVDNFNNVNQEPKQIVNHYAIDSLSLPNVLTDVNDIVKMFHVLPEVTTQHINNISVQGKF